jgi:hypothetical protein
VVRSSIPPEQVINAIRREIHSIDADQPISKVEIMEQAIRDEITIPKFAATLSSGFTAQACLLALIGVAATVAFAVIQRTHEIGVRMALGANRPQAGDDTRRPSGRAGHWNGAANQPLALAAHASLSLWCARPGAGNSRSGLYRESDLGPARLLPTCDTSDAH